MSDSFSKSLWDQYYAKVYGYFYRRIDDKFLVEDLTAETLNDFFLGSKNSSMQYLWGIARNKLYGFLRQKYKDNALNLEDEDKILVDFGQHYGNHFLEKVELLKECVKEQLTELDQDIVNLSISEDFNGKDLALKLNLSEGNVRIRLFRAIKKLKTKCKQIWLTDRNYD
jgi:RNA polymerase sigma-70 factor (ECF subfamily)